MSEAKIAVQLYSVREELARDLRGTLERLQEMGYTAVETGGFAGDASEQAKIYSDLGLRVVAAHMPPPVGEDKERILDDLELLGSNRLVVPWLDPQQYFASPDGIRQAADLLNEAAANTLKRGLLFHYHNHDFEFSQVEGRLAFERLLAQLDPRVLFEIDTYWVQTAGEDAASVVRQLGERAPLLHIKDGLLKRELPMVAVGDGSMDFTKVIPAGQPHTRWLIVELDQCAGDMLHALGRSYTYLTALQTQLG